MGGPAGVEVHNPFAFLDLVYVFWIVLFFIRPPSLNIVSFFLWFRNIAGLYSGIVRARLQAIRIDLPSVIPHRYHEALLWPSRRKPEYHDQCYRWS